MQVLINIDHFVKSVKRSIEYEELRHLKAQLAADGFNFQHSFYYFVKIDGVSKYRRVEVISYYPFTPLQIEYLHQIFAMKVSGFDYALWLFNPMTYELWLETSIDRRDR